MWNSHWFRRYWFSVRVRAKWGRMSMSFIRSSRLCSCHFGKVKIVWVGLGLGIGVILSTLAGITGGSHCSERHRSTKPRKGVGSVTLHVVLRGYRKAPVSPVKHWKWQLESNWPGLASALAQLWESSWQFQYTPLHQWHFSFKCRSLISWTLMFTYTITNVGFYERWIYLTTKQVSFIWKKKKSPHGELSWAFAKSWYMASSFYNTVPDYISGCSAGLLGVNHFLRYCQVNVTKPGVS